MKLSIILPVYNVEKYIGQCIESCLRQDISLDEYEIVVVIDGSKDQSLSIAQGYAARFPNIVIIEQENRGLSGARNTGLRCAKGKYVWFVDSDDYIADNCLSLIHNKMEKDQLEVLFVNRNIVDEQGALSHQPVLNKEIGVVSGTDFYCMSPEGSYVAWRYIFLRSFLLNNNLIFCEGIIHEDIEFGNRLFYFVNHITLTNEALYNYRMRKGSIMSSGKGTERLRSMRIILESHKRFNNEIVRGNNYRRRLNRSIVSLCSMYLYQMGEWGMISEKEIKAFKLLNPLDGIKPISIYEWIKITLMKYQPRFYALFIRKFNALKNTTFPNAHPHF